MSRHVIVHIGPPKTASTTIQRGFLGVCPQTNPHYSARISRRLSEAVIRYAKTPHWQRDLHAARAETLTFMRELPDGAAICSHEALFGNFHNSFMTFRNYADAIRELFSSCKVILYLRRQDIWAESLYTQALREYWAILPDSFFIFDMKAFEHLSECNWPTLYIGHLGFADKIQYLDCLFGQENVHVGVFETIAEPEIFYRPWAQALRLNTIELPLATTWEKRGYSAASARVAAHLNRLVRTPYRLGGIIPSQPFSSTIRSLPFKRETRDRLLNMAAHITPRAIISSTVGRVFTKRPEYLSDSQRREVIDMHAPGNRWVAERIGLNLGRFGYY